MVQIPTPEEGRLKTCTICRQKINEETDLILCPFCASAYHQKHIEEWLTHNNSCPVCQITLKEENVEVTPENTPPKSTQNLISHFQAYQNTQSRPGTSLFYHPRRNIFQQVPVDEDTKDDQQNKGLILIGILVFIFLFSNSTGTIVVSLIIVFLICFIYLLKNYFLKRFHRYLSEE